MSRVIELNDVGVVLAEEGQVLATSPGYAFFDETGPVFGEAARAASHLQPLRINHQFWSELSTRPLARPIAGIRSHADLAFQHLTALLKGRAPAEGCRVLVPSAMTVEQLGLLRAIAAEAGLGRVTVIDTAVAAGRALPGAGRACFVDVELDRATLTQVQIGADIERGRALVVPGAGHLGFLQRWLETIARDMVFSTRFDPLAQGATEQALFDALPGLIREAALHGRATLTLGSDENPHSIDVTREQLVAAASTLADDIVTRLHRLRFAGEASLLALSARAGMLTGLKERLAELTDTECFVLEAAAPLTAVSGRFSPTLGEAHRVTSLKSLPASDRATLGATAVALPGAATAKAPTHLLYRGQAITLAGESLTIGTAVTAAMRELNVAGATAGISRSHCTLMQRGRDFMVFDHSTYGTWLNDERVAHGAHLKVGDKLRLGSPGVVLDFIAIDTR